MRNGGAGDITIIDGHTWGEQDNVIEDRIEDSVRVIQGPELHHLDLYSWKSDAAVLVGRHAMAGTKKGFMSHTINLELGVRLRINGRPVGEIGFWALWAGLQRIPVILLTGDKAAGREASELRGAHFASVKEGMNRTRCKCFPKNAALKHLEKSSREAVENLKSVKPLQLPKKFVTDVSFSSEESAKAALSVPRSSLIRPNIVQYTAQDYKECRRFVNAAIALASCQNTGSLLLGLRRNRANRLATIKWIRRQYRRALSGN
jgi:D-amino peptidase